MTSRRLLRSWPRGHDSVGRWQRVVGLLRAAKSSKARLAIGGRGPPSAYGLASPDQMDRKQLLGLRTQDDPSRRVWQIVR